MNKFLILLMAAALFSSCRKAGGSTGGARACWACAIEGKYNGSIVDIDTTICDKTKAEIDAYMSQHNQVSSVVNCTLAGQ
ncbi:MAG: hypothetical protein JNL72_00480 [Flavipsychrobacter sp.]|nr:hypothetical protein [Flavipsychrobacter sp.]